MKIVVFSDTHLHLPFNKRQFYFLEKIITQADRVIINGDFFDGHLISFDDFISSAWSRLFPLLKNKKTVYIHGNHDCKEMTNRNTNLFCNVEVDHYKLIINGKAFIFEHGQRLRPTPDVILKFNFYKPHFIIAFCVKISHAVRCFFTKTLGKTFVTLRFAYRNKVSKKRIKKLYQPKENEVYLIGHNHFGEVDEKNHFAATGMILYGFAQYLTIDNGKISLHETWYE